MEVTVHEALSTFMNISHPFILRITNNQKEFVDNIETHILC